MTVPLLALFLSVQATQTSTHQVSIEEYLQLKDIRSVQVSPTDGSVAFTLTEPDVEAGEYRTELYLRRRGEQARALIRGRNARRRAHLCALFVPTRCRNRLKSSRQKAENTLDFIGKRSKIHPTGVRLRIRRLGVRVSPAQTVCLGSRRPRLWAALAVARIGGRANGVGADGT